MGGKNMPHNFQKFHYLLLACLMAGMADVAEAGSVQFSTYYPAPFGMYDRLRLVPRTGLTPPCDPGTLYINNEAGNQLEVCNAAGNAWAPLSGGPWTQDANGVYVTDITANVGIGTTTPDEELHVHQTVGNVALRLGDFGINDWDLIRSVGNDSIPSGSFALKMNGAAAPILVADTTGKVGIGTTTPANILTIVGDNKDVHLYSYDSSTPSAKADYDILRARGTEASPLPVQNGDGLGSIRFRGMEPNLAFQSAGFPAAQILVDVDGAPGVGIMPTRMTFRTSGTSAGTLDQIRMVINPAGNVGIGATTPTSRLHVNAPQGDAPPGVFLENADMSVDGGVDGTFGLRNTSASGTRKISIGGPGLGTETMTVDVLTDRVGIVTTNPQGGLHILDFSPNGAVAGLLIERNSQSLGRTPRVVLVDTALGAVTAAPAWEIDNNLDQFRIFRQANISTAGPGVLSINNNGNVVIGTTAPGPTYKLEVTGGPIKATGGLIIPTCTIAAGDCPASPVNGQIWLCTDCP